MISKFIDGYSQSIKNFNLPSLMLTYLPSPNAIPPYLTCWLTSIPKSITTLSHLHFLHFLQGFNPPPPNKLELCNPICFINYQKNLKHSIIFGWKRLKTTTNGFIVWETFNILDRLCTALWIPCVVCYQPIKNCNCIGSKKVSLAVQCDLYHCLIIFKTVQ